MRKLYQKEWFGIDFKSFTVLDSKKVADVSFYDRFYDEFYKKFNSYEALPEDWKSTKKMVADLILRLTSNKEKILSIGSGNGYIEYLLRKDGRDITAIEPSKKAARFLRQFSDARLYNGYFPRCLENADDASFDFAYMSATEYVLNETEMVKLIADIRDLGVKIFLLVSASVYQKTILRVGKDIVKQILSYIGLYELGLFWGYSRTTNEFIKAFKKVGFKDIESGFLRKDTFWIKGAT